MELIDRVPEYWTWLIHLGEQGRVKILQEIYVELTAGSDELKRWVSQTDSKRALKFKEEVDIELVRRVVEEGYAPDLSEDELEKIGKDPFLVAYALVDPNNRVIVTAERSKPTAERSNRKVPDVCKQFKIRSCSAPTFGRELDFRTNWDENTRLFA